MLTIFAPVRRTGLLLATLAGLLLGAAPARAFSLDDLTTHALALAAKPYQEPQSNLPPAFSQMQFDDYIRIQPRPEGFAWAQDATPFKLGFYHQGMQFSSPVPIHELVGDAVQDLPYDPSRFNFNGLAIDAEATRNLGYAGFRVLYPLNRPDKSDEVMSLLGASYFRVIGKGQVYGLSGRGLAIDTGLAEPEEFPRFREFWVRRPAPQDRQLVIYALLDSPRATGAYEFTLTPGDDSLLDVRARIFLRGAAPKVLGVAPLTSMFLFGPSQHAATPNFRPAIHDSNGLAIHAANGEWLWRPLNNPPQVVTSHFRADSLQGFGLLQRGREFSRFEDLKDRYDLRPSAWIEPRGDWGPGSVTLLELPTPDETNDNIAAFWQPDVLPAPGTPLALDYRIHWTRDEAALFGGGDIAWVRQTLRAAGERYQPNLVRQTDGSLALIVDFEGPSLARLPAGTAVTASVSGNAAVRIVGTTVQANPAIRGWRLTLRVQHADPAQAGELRAALAGPDGRTLTETWSYQLPPQPVPRQVPAPAAAPEPSAAPAAAPAQQ
ncbi:MAG: Glucans biosynthesis protein G [Xylophilus sp.]|nr:MAG: Glucans biosynthesis protein G [Xylophilus sp.]